VMRPAFALQLAVLALLLFFHLAYLF